MRVFRSSYITAACLTTAVLLLSLPPARAQYQGEGVCVKYCDESSDGGRDDSYPWAEELGRSMNRALRNLLFGDPEAARRNAMNLNGQGNKLFDSGDYAGALEKYKEALKHAPNDRVIQGSAAASEAMVAADAHNYDLAVRKMREAMALYPERERKPWVQDALRSFEDELAQEQAAQQEEQRRLAEQARQYGEVRQTLTGLADRLATNPSNSGGTAGATGGTVPGRESSAFFGVQGNPSGLQFMPATPDQGVTNKNNLEQLSSIKKDSEAAKNAGSLEQAKRQAGCGTADNPCQKGDAAPTVTIKGRPGGFASLPPEKLKALMRTKDGPELVANEVALQKKLEEADAKVKASEEAWSKTQSNKDMMAVTQAREARDKIRQEHQAAQVKVEEKARTIVVLDPSDGKSTDSSAKRNVSPPPPAPQ